MAVASYPSSTEPSRAMGPAPEVWREGPRAVVAVRGEQDLSTAGRLADALAAASAIGRGDLVVDLSGVLFMDSAIIRAVVQRREALRAQSRELSLRAPSAFAWRILAMCRLVDLVDAVPAATTEIGSCVTVRGTWSPSPQGRRAFDVAGRAGSPPTALERR